MRYLAFLVLLLTVPARAYDDADNWTFDATVRVHGDRIAFRAVDRCSLRGRADGQDTYHTYWAVTTPRCGTLRITDGIIIVAKVDSVCTTTVRLDGLDDGYQTRVLFTYPVECP